MSAVAHAICAGAAVHSALTHLQPIGDVHVELLAVTLLVCLMFPLVLGSSECCHATSHITHVDGIGNGRFLMLIIKRVVVAGTEIASTSKLVQYRKGSKGRCNIHGAAWQVPMNGTWGMRRGV